MTEDTIIFDRCLHGGELIWKFDGGRGAMLCPYCERILGYYRHSAETPAALPEKRTMTDVQRHGAWDKGQQTYEDGAATHSCGSSCELDPPRLPLNREHRDAIMRVLRDHEPPTHLSGLPDDEYECCADALAAAVRALLTAEST